MQMLFLFGEGRERDREGGGNLKIGAADNVNNSSIDNINNSSVDHINVP